MRGDSAAVVVAGGRGKRFGGPIRKQFLSLSGRPLLWWAVHAFEQSPSIGAIVVVVPPPALVWAHRQFSRWKVRTPMQIVGGGKTRADSVRQGLAVVPPDVRWVAIHDGVRPLVTPRLIEQVLKETRMHRAAIAACPSRDSVKVATARGMIQRSLPRETVWLAQTPQAFERKLLERAHSLNGNRGKLRGDFITDDSMLVERLGVKVKLVDGTPDNLKVTVPSDLHLAERLLKRRQK